MATGQITSISASNKSQGRIESESSVTEAFIKSLEEEHTHVDGMLSPRAVTHGLEAPLDVEDLLPSGFIEQHTNAASPQTLFDPYEVETSRDLLRLPEFVDAHVAYTTPYANLKGLLVAGLEYRLG